MAGDIRTQVASYYDLSPSNPHDLPFYERQIPSPEARVLELGCGTGRVLLPLVDVCGFIQGVDRSEAMLSLCRRKLAAATVPLTKARVRRGDISDLDLGQRFDLIIAPFRVLQNLETDAQVDGLFETVHKHLAPGGTCILNVFQPNRDPDGLRREWCSAVERVAWEVPVEGGRVTCHDKRVRMDPDKLVLYPELIYRRYEGDVLVDTAVLRIAMRCYYPAEFERLVVDHGFRITGRWGGYAGEPYGGGPELVLQFMEGDEGVSSRSATTY